MTTKWIVAMNLLLCAAFLAPVRPQGADVRSGTSAAAQGRLASLLRAPLPGKAAAQGSPAMYSPESLYQYIDGGADLYVLYDFKALLHQEFKSGAADLTADIYEMSNAEDAFGIYASERSPGYKFLAIGAEGYRDQGILNFFADHYYIKLSGSGANADSLLDQFARVLAVRIGGARTLPNLLEKFPREHRVAHSEQYVKKDPLGHGFLAPAYVVTYTQGKQESQLVVSVAGDAQAAKSRAEQLSQHFKQSGECAAAPDLGESGLRGNNSFEGRVIARTRGRYLIALFNPADSGAEILKATAQNLP